MDASSLDVIVLNWRTPEMSAACARVAAERLPGAAIYIVDNGSGDGSPARIRQAFPAATVVENERNLGFGGGFNTGIRAGRRPFLLALNSDALPVDDCYRQLLEHCASDPRLAAVTPQTVDREGRPVGQMPPEPTPLRLVAGCLPVVWRMSQKPYMLPPGPPRQLDWFPSMCATLFRREALEGIGAFDTGYFLGWEEWDLARRLQSAGWKIAAHPGAAVVHEGHGSTPRPLKDWRYKYGRQGICYHLRKYHGPAWYAVGRVASGFTNVVMDLRARTAGRAVIQTTSAAGRERST
jgi:N-acetylglucosaminyl-diphospho-decaprenol L-rhamnosyltransferase